MVDEVNYGQWNSKGYTRTISPKSEPQQVAQMSDRIGRQLEILTSTSLSKLFPSFSNVIIKEARAL